MKILYLYTEVMGYNLPIFARLVEEYGASVDVMHWNKNKLTPFVPTEDSGVKFHDRSDFSTQDMIQFVTSLGPDLIYISGWQDKGYLPVAAYLKKKGVPVVMGLDSQWTGSLRQKIGAQIIKHWYKKRYFSYAWVPGPLQYEYASRVGFEKNEIICNLLSANSKVFQTAAAALHEKKRITYPKRFLYVGRFAYTKGIDLLVRAYEIYQKKYHGDWGLTCVGNGPMQDEFLTNSKIVVKLFLTQAELADEAARAGAFVLPSREDPWGVVVHEFATAGLPLILSEHVGSSKQFLVDGLNGYVMFDDSAKDLALKMHLVASASSSKLIDMSNISHQLASSLTPQIAAASFMSVLQRETVR
jgi:glycosyltransferase involved in cell wall biosynthesis